MKKIKDFFSNFQYLPVETKRLLSIGVILALVLALPLFIWGITTQRFDVRERAASGEPTLPPVNYVDWRTQWATFSAKNYQIQTPSETQLDRVFVVNPSKPCNIQTREMVCVSSNPPGLNSQGLHYMTLEVTWFENDIEMRMFIYLYSDGSKWWSDEIRVYNGQPYPNSDWVYFYGRFFETSIGQSFTQGQQMVLTGIDSKTGGTVTLSFSDVDFQAFQNYLFSTPTPTPIAQKPDLVIKDITLERVGPPEFACDSYLYKITVQNLSSASASLSRFQVNLNPTQKQAINNCSSYQDYSTTTVPVPDTYGEDFFRSGATQVIKDYFNPDKAGTVEITGIADVYDQVDETIETNNTLSRSFTVESVIPTPPPISRPFEIKLKLSGVEDASANLAKVTVRFISKALNYSLGYITPPIPINYLGNGIYKLMFGVWSADLPAANDYTLILKGEKHLAKRFCYMNGQTQRCTSSEGNIAIPNSPSEKVSLDFTGMSLEPGDLYPQDGVVDTNDFAKIKALLGKSCSDLTGQDKLVADLDYSGCVNIRDAFLMRKTLETRYDEF